MNITIKDIAQKLNLNFSSVSRALNNKPGVSDETRKLVIATAKKMGYRPNTIARGLVSNQTKTLGVLMPDITNPLFGEITTSIIETANEYNYDVFLSISNWNKEKEIHNIHTMKQKQVDGIIIKSVNDANTKLLEESSIPVIGYETWTNNQKFSSISSDNEKGGYLAAKHLLKCGYRYPAYIQGPENSSASFHRRNGFFKALKESTPNIAESLYTGEYNIESGYLLTKRLLKEKPKTDAIFAGNDVMALGVLQYLDENHIKPGLDFGVIGFDDISFCKLPRVKLTTIKQPKHNIGRIMTKLVIDEIKESKKNILIPPQRILLEPELIERETTAIQ